MSKHSRGSYNHASYFIASKWSRTEQSRCRCTFIDVCYVYCTHLNETLSTLGMQGALDIRTKTLCACFVSFLSIFVSDFPQGETKVWFCEYMKRLAYQIVTLVVASSHSLLLCPKINVTTNETSNPFEVFLCWFHCGFIDLSGLFNYFTSLLCWVGTYVDQTFFYRFFVPLSSLTW